MEDAVDRQLRAYNERDLDEFMDCYADVSSSRTMTAASS
jgi:hypothetical protein